MTRKLDLEAVRAMVEGHGGRMVAMRDLPPAYQMAAAQYMSLAGEAWDLPPLLEEWLPLHWVEFTADRARTERSLLEHQRLFAEEFPKHMPFYVERYGAATFGVVEVPITAMIALIMTGDHMEHYDGSWERYHAWYVGQGYMPDYDVSKPLWPVWIDINGCDDQLLEDGWHRFHDYARKGVQVVPAIYFPVQERREDQR
jgi:hypothetical protein